MPGNATATQETSSGTIAITTNTPTHQHPPTPSSSQSISTQPHTPNQSSKSPSTQHFMLEYSQTNKVSEYNKDGKDSNPSDRPEPHMFLPITRQSGVL